MTDVKSSVITCSARLLLRRHPSKTSGSAIPVGTRSAPSGGGRETRCLSEEGEIPPASIEQPNGHTTRSSHPESSPG
jgi:hypothetical protein